MTDLFEIQKQLDSIIYEPVTPEPSPVPVDETPQEKTERIEGDVLQAMAEETANEEIAGEVVKNINYGAIVALTKIAHTADPLTGGFDATDIQPPILEQLLRQRLVQREGDSYAIPDAVRQATLALDKTRTDQYRRIVQPAAASPIRPFDNRSLWVKVNELMAERAVEIEAARTERVRKDAHIQQEVAQQYGPQVTLLRLFVGCVVLLLTLTVGAYIPALFGVVDLWAFWNGSLMAQIGGGGIVTLFGAAVIYLFVAYVRQTPKQGK